MVQNESDHCCWILWFQGLISPARIPLTLVQMPELSGSLRTCRALRFMWFSMANQQVSRLVCLLFAWWSFCGLKIFVINKFFFFSSQSHIPADWQCTAVIWDSPKWPVLIPESLTVRSLETPSLVKSELHWQFWVRMILYYILTNHIYSILIVLARLRTV